MNVATAKDSKKDTATTEKAATETTPTTADTVVTSNMLPGNVPADVQPHNLPGSEVHGDSGTGQLDRETATDNALRNSSTDRQDA